MFAGIGFVVLFVAGVVLTFSDTPEIKESDTAQTAAQKWVTEFSTSGHRVGIIVGAYVLLVAAIAFVWFCNGLRERLSLSVGAGRIVSGLSVLGAGVIAVATMFGGASVAGGVEFGENPLPSGESLRTGAEPFYPLLFVAFGIVSAAIIVTIAVSAARAGTLPRWLAYAGWLGALGSILGVIFFPVVLALLWYLAVAIVGLRARGGGPAQATPSASPTAGP
jgi:hypothetical protein